MAVSPLPATRSPRDNSAPREGASRTHIATARMQTFVQWLRSAQLAIGWAVMLLILGAAAGVYLHQVSTTALVGRNAELLDIELHSLRETNAQVRQQIALMQSLDRMQERTYSYNLQFIDSSPEAIEYLEVIIPAPVASPPEAIAPLVPPPDSLGQALLLLAYENVSVLGRGFSNGE
ncbi:MAG: hypothetical protein ACPG8W_07010 [Candidatus Promineifilaceae bacterium]